MTVSKALSNWRRPIDRAATAGRHIRPPSKSVAVADDPTSRGDQPLGRSYGYELIPMHTRAQRADARVSGTEEPQGSRYHAAQPRMACRRDRDRLIDLDACPKPPP